jgi:hypothetical protein
MRLAVVCRPGTVAVGQVMAKGAAESTMGMAYPPVLTYRGMQQKDDRAAAI